MIIVEVNKESYARLTRRFAGMLFHRIDEEGRFLIKPLKSAENDVLEHRISSYSPVD